MSRFIIITLGSINNCLSINQLKFAVKNYIKSDEFYHTTDFNIEFEKSLKELMGSFINTTKDKNNLDIIDFFNHSIFDFIVKYLKEREDILKTIIKRSVFLDQILTVYQIYNHKVPTSLKILCENEVLDRFNDLRLVRNNRSFHFSPYYSWSDADQSIIKKIYHLSITIMPVEDKKLHLLLRDLFFNTLDKQWQDYSYDEIIRIYMEFYEYDEDEKLSKLMNTLIDNCHSLDNIIELYNIKDINETAFNTAIEDKITVEKITSIVKYRYKINEPDESLRNQIEEVSNLYAIDFDTYISEIDDIIRQQEDENKEVSVHNNQTVNEDKKDQKKEIINLFDTLLLR